MYQWHGFEWGKNVFQKQWWRIYIHPLKHMVFCRKNCPQGVTLPLVILNYFWLNLNVSRSLLISLCMLSQSHHPFRFCVSRLCCANLLMRLDQMVLRTRRSLRYMDLVGFCFGLVDLIPQIKSWFVFGVHSMYSKSIPPFLFSGVHAPSEQSNVCHKPRGCVTVRTTCVWEGTLMFTSEVHFWSELKGSCSFCASPNAST